MTKGGTLDDMIVYVDEFGNFSDEPPEPPKAKDKKKDDKKDEKRRRTNRLRPLTKKAILTLLEWPFFI